MNLQHIERNVELAKVLQALPQAERHIIIDAVSLPAHDRRYIETLTDHVHRIQDELYLRRVY